MKNKILAGVCLLGMFAVAGATGVWPDGSAMDAWFADKSPPVEGLSEGESLCAEAHGAVSQQEEPAVLPAEVRRHLLR